MQCNWAGGSVSAWHHLSPNYLVITPGCRRPFTVPSHEVLFLPINTYLPILTNLPTTFWPRRHALINALPKHFLSSLIFKQVGSTVARNISMTWIPLSVSDIYHNTSKYIYLCLYVCIQYSCSLKTLLVVFMACHSDMTLSETETWQSGWSALLSYSTAWGLRICAGETHCTQSRGGLWW